MTPDILVLGGPNGAGKTTVAGSLLPEALGVEQFVNADLIARGLSPFAPEKSAFRAGRLMLGRIRELHERRESFAFETTLASRSYARFLGEASRNGYAVHTIFVWLATVELALSRIAGRVREGGHDVAADVVKRRYRRGLRNLFELYMPLADSWTVCDNSGPTLSIVAQCSRGNEPSVFDPVTFEAIQRQAKHETS